MEESWVMECVDCTVKKIAGVMLLCLNDRVNDDFVLNMMDQIDQAA